MGELVGSWQGIAIRASSQELVDATRASLDVLSTSDEGRTWIGGMQEVGSWLDVYSGDQWVTHAKLPASTFGHVRVSDPRRILLQGPVLERDQVKGALLIGHEAVHSWQISNGRRGSTAVLEGPAYHAEGVIAGEFGKDWLRPKITRHVYRPGRGWERPTVADVIARMRAGETFGSKVGR